MSADTRAANCNLATLKQRRYPWCYSLLTSIKSKYLRAEDLKQDKKVPDQNRHRRGVRAGGSRKEARRWFTNDERGWCSTRRTTGRSGRLWRRIDDWAGKIIVVFPTMADFRGKMAPALRVRIPPPKDSSTSTAGACTKPRRQMAEEPVAAARRSRQQENQSIRDDLDSDDESAEALGWRDAGPPPILVRERAVQDNKPTTYQGDLAKLPRALAPLVERPQWVAWRWSSRQRPLAEAAVSGARSAASCQH